jgi:leucyl-tRNA synthetase
MTVATSAKQAETYSPGQIEAYWAQRWEEDQLYRSVVDWSKPKHYALTMLPYPSGDLHIGHWFAMTPSDARARYMRMKGYNVLFPMGFDAFGLPAEQAAISRNIPPAKWTYANIERMRKQMRSMGAMFDWKREAVSCDPAYYRWTEWFFKQFYQHGLAYQGEAMVNWSPTLQTVLANEQVIDGKDERTGQPVIQKLMTQWFFKITAYAEELLQFEGLDWPEAIRMMQTHWIGRSEGAHITFKTEAGDDLRVYTTRPDTLWGATFMVIAPEHPLVAKLTTPAQAEAVQAYQAQAARTTELERTAENREKTGVFTGGYAINPATQTRIPVWIADYVMVNYGTGAIMAVPFGDQRDFEFARQFHLPIIPVVQPEGEAPFEADTMEAAYPGAGIMVNSGPLNGIRCNGEKGRQNPSIEAAITWLENQGVGQGAINYRLRDWLISRQRYWGSPIPMIARADGAWETVPDEQLPVLLPDEVEFKPTGQSPLKLYESFYNTVDSSGQPATRETDTMDTFMCSSWYHLRYLSPQYDQGPFDPEEAAYWLPVDVYTGGAEHATMHLLYTRFFNKALRDTGVFDSTLKTMAAHGRQPESILDEPMLLLRNQGQVLGEERQGDYLALRGRWEGDKIFADWVEVIPFDEEAPNDATAQGELMKRVENVLHINTGAEDWQVVEVQPGAKIIIPQIDGENELHQLRHHLEVQRMSKSKGNVVNPDELVSQYGGDTVRAYLMFAFKWEKGGPWDSQGIQGVVRWLEDVWRIVVAGPPKSSTPDEKVIRALRRKLHQTIRRVDTSLETFSFNTAVAALMEFKNSFQKAIKDGGLDETAWQEAARDMLLMMAPITPFIAEELWASIGGPYSIHQQAFPVYDEALAAEEEITLIVQIEGKVRDKIQAPAGISEAEAIAKALASEAVQRILEGSAPKKVIYIAKTNIVSIVK